MVSQKLHENGRESDHSTPPCGYADYSSSFFRKFVLNPTRPGKGRSIATVSHVSAYDGGEGQASVHGCGPTDRGCANGNASLYKFLEYSHHHGVGRRSCASDRGPFWCAGAHERALQGP